MVFYRPRKETPRLPTPPLPRRLPNPPPNSPESTYKPEDQSSIPSIAGSPLEPFPAFGNEQQVHNPPIGAEPYSPFYNHETPTPAVSAARTESKQELHDPESGVPRGHALKRRGHSGLCDEKERRCACWQRLGEKERLVLEILIAIAILGTMVGIALGITAAVGGGIVKSNDQRGRLGE